MAMTVHLKWASLQRTTRKMDSAYGNRYTLSQINISVKAYSKMGNVLELSKFTTIRTMMAFVKPHLIFALNRNMEFLRLRLAKISLSNRNTLISQLPTSRIGLSEKYMVNVGFHLLAPDANIEEWLMRMSLMMSCLTIIAWFKSVLYVAIFDIKLF